MTGRQANGERQVSPWVLGVGSYTATELLTRRKKPRTVLKATKVSGVYVVLGTGSEAAKR